MRTLAKKHVEASVYEKGLERVRELYRRFDKVAVGFSGGKDSTVCLQLALQVAQEVGRLPLDVYTFDEEAVHPETVEYIQRVADNPDVRFRWYCLPVQHRNACSRAAPWWYPWDPAKRNLWVRPLPKTAIMTLPGFEMGMDHASCVQHIYGPEFGTVAHIRGIRAQESLRRLRIVSLKEVDNWIATTGKPHAFQCSPIYDWAVEDVWLAPKLLGWDYNRAYDVMDKAGVSKNIQRVCPPYGEEPLGSLHIYAECWPQLWEKMIARVPGAATAARYARTELYGYGGIVLPEGHSWQSYFQEQIGRWPPAERGEIMANLARAMKAHAKKTRGRPIPDQDADPVSGLSWRFICEIALRGDLKGRRMGSLADKAIKRCNQLGITLGEAMKAVR